jgi:hypothetical protein
MSGPVFKTLGTTPYYSQDKSNLGAVKKDMDTLVKKAAAVFDKTSLPRARE